MMQNRERESEITELAKASLELITENDLDFMILLPPLPEC